MQTFSYATVVFAALLIAGCSAATEESEADDAFRQVGEAIQADAINYIENPTLKAFAQVLRESSNGVTGTIVTQPTGSPEAGNCGITFISKHYAVTAAHCVNGYAFGTQAINAYRILTTTLDTLEADQAADVSGTWPNWTITDTLTSNEGYQKTGHNCFLKYRCTPNPNDVNKCPSGAQNTDLALLHCPSRPAPKDYLTVNTGNPGAGTDVEIHWYHEVLDLARYPTDPVNNVPANNWANYGSYSGIANTDDNYHYTGAFDHQYLPLRSKTWPSPSAAAYEITSNTGTDPLTYTNVPTCHGTSGSGVFVQGNSTLLGPVSLGNAYHITQLCHDWTDTDPTEGNSSFTDAPKTKLLETSVVTGDR